MIKSNKLIEALKTNLINLGYGYFKIDKKIARADGGASRLLIFFTDESITLNDAILISDSYQSIIKNENRELWFFSYDKNKGYYFSELCDYEMN